MVTASAPGKIILLGEHAVVHGEPAVAVAVDLRARVTVTAAPEGAGSTVNGFPLTRRHHAHIRLAAERFASDAALRFDTESPIPTSAGLGSSAAITTATVRALLARGGAFEGPEQLAREAYDVEWHAQGGMGSPTDTSTATHGGGVIVEAEPGKDLLWSVTRGARTWHLHHLDVPDLPIVIGNTRQRGRTAEQVAKVTRFVNRSSFAREMITEIGEVTRLGMDAVRRRDAHALGAAMDFCHNALTILGVSTPRLERAVDAARRAGALGAKLTGSGGGGAMIALPDGDPERVVAALQRIKVDAFVTQVGVEGARLEADA